MSTGARVRVLVVACVVAAVAIAGYIVLRPPPVPPLRVSDSPADTARLDAIQAQPHVYVRSMRAEEFGRVVVASLAQPNEDRYVSSVSCDRVAFGREGGVCLTDNRAKLTPPGLLRVLDRRLRVLRTAPLAGVPSRARVARDGRHAATTVFVSGESYATLGFATRTHVLDLATSDVAVPHLEQFTTWRGEDRVQAADVNFWGVTFGPDSRTFLATLATGGLISLVRGDASTRTLRVVREDVECPSLSPDGTRVAFKRRVKGTPAWRLHVLDLEAGREWPIATETRSIDDQVEWLDDTHVIYAYLEERGLPEVAANVWLSSALEGSQEPPRLFVRAAVSPTVVR